MNHWLLSNLRFCYLIWAIVWAIVVVWANRFNRINTMIFLQCLTHFFISAENSINCMIIFSTSISTWVAQSYLFEILFIGLSLSYHIMWYSRLEGKEDLSFFFKNLRSSVKIAMVFKQLIVDISYKKYVVTSLGTWHTRLQSNISRDFSEC